MSSTRRVVLTVALLSFLLSAKAANASRNFASYAVLPQLMSPISITLCRAWMTDTPSGNIDYFINAAMSFRNVASDAVVAVRFRFDLYSTFNEHLGSLYGNKEGRFSPNIPIEPREALAGLVPDFSWINIHGSATQIVCSVDTAKYANGTIWQANFAEDTSRLNRAAQSLSPSPISSAGHALVATPAPHPSSCIVKLSDGSPLEIPWENAGCAKSRASWEKQQAAAQAKQPRPALTPAPTSIAISVSDEAAWNANRELSCDQVALRDVLPHSSVNEREAYLRTHADWKARVELCVDWRQAHPTPKK